MSHPMSDEAGLLEHIREQPDDDTPRLIYADWCEENDRPERAELIRLQCELAAVPEYDRSPEALARERALLRRHGKEWAGLLATVRSLEWRRGFIDLIRCPAGRFLADGPALLAAAPVREVVLTSPARYMTKLAAGPALRGVRHLALEGPGLTPAALQNLLAAPGLRDLVGLKLSRIGLTAEHLQALASSGIVPRLEVFEAQHGRFRGDDLRVFCDAGPARLRRLSLRRNSIGPEGAAVLAGSPHLANLTHLDLAYCELTAPTGQHLASSPHLRRLERLDLHFNTFNRPGAEALAASPILATVQELEIGFNEITDAGLRALARSPHLTNLRHLNVSHSYLRKNGLSGLIASPLLPRLQYLALHYNSITDEQLAQLADSPAVAGLRHLILRSNDFGPVGVAAVAASPHLAGLRRLMLDNNKFGLVVARALAGSPYLAGLWELSCTVSDCTRKGAEVLRTRFGKVLELGE